mmetsp:Transcript_15555/g.39547  ORF Transcript_15555/g.39547 Transcript_15555/m.39547 type:complete len:126 (-) Transcript_15555:498-875(-)
MGFGLDAINESNLLMFSGCICCNASFYLDFPACVGCSGKGKLLCLEGAYCLKLNTPQMKCICCDIKLDTRNLTPFLKCQHQYCCLVSAFALPPDSEVPMTLGVWFIFCYPAFGVCKTQGALTMGR